MAEQVRGKAFRCMANQLRCLHPHLRPCLLPYFLKPIQGTSGAWTRKVPQTQDVAVVHNGVSVTPASWDQAMDMKQSANEKRRRDFLVAFGWGGRTAEYCSLDVIALHRQAIHCRVSHDRCSFLFTACLWQSKCLTWKELWDFLLNLANSNSEPWLVAGDFNDIVSEDEKMGGAPFNQSSLRRFRETLDRCGLIDLGTYGPWFTWRGQETQRRDRVFERLDRAVCNSSGRTLLSEAAVRVLPRLKSDHHPPTWLNHVDLPVGLEDFKLKVQDWNRELSISRELEEILTQEEILWFQKSSSNWVRFGDRNLKYFHKKTTIIKRKHIQIETLQGEDGNWISDEDQLRSLVVGHFSALYGIFEAGLEEIRRAIFVMGSFKSPGPDGFQAIFYQANRDVVSSALVDFVQGVLDRGLWNGCLMDAFSMGRGIRQDRPLSPYLFVLCVEHLAHLISDLVQAGRGSSMQVRLQDPLISHLMFVDDLLLFAEASEEQMVEVRSVLNHFCDASGQRVSTAKTVAFSSKNVELSRQESILSHSSFSRTDDLGKYLGIPIIHDQVNESYLDSVVV
ncbi:hypothetical protein CRG98_017505 [Punica granatum]|uniref:Uncharacterized protein n=1 Tax=Punica granatum TaxID=22663 RepID=A0A2I0K0Q3_PUNGR|nr:hypothetical protein CRG98_017505 [Punica granatum]